MSLTARIEALVAQPVTRMSALHGGDLSEVWQARLANGSDVVVKSGPRVAVEARMLHAMANAGAPVPRVLGTSGELLVLEALQETRASSASWLDAGRALRALHNSTARHYGWTEDYAFGPLPIVNTPQEDWPGFWAEHRLRGPAAKLPADLRSRIDRLAADLPNRLPGRPPVALLHGDLWSGNLLHSADRAYLIDPACYHGDAEVDLAMLHVFGTPPPDFASAYGALEPGWQERRAIYQLWPAIVHFRLFGSGYRSLVTGRLERTGV